MLKVDKSKLKGPLKLEGVLSLPGLLEGVSLSGPKLLILLLSLFIIREYLQSTSEYFSILNKESSRFIVVMCTILYINESAQIRELSPIAC